jgi:hypothetical protein
MAKTLALMLLMSGSPPTEIMTLSTESRDATEVSKSSSDSRNAANHSGLEPRRSTVETGSSSTVAGNSVHGTTARQRILRRQQALRGGQQQAMDGLISLIQSNIAPDCWEFVGSGISVGNGNAAGSGQSASQQNAENLVELIQQTTRPLSWDVNGGNGSISIFP